ncbi:MAG: hypothetical protein P0S96_08610 [Simkaniaceae bacterium]|nr:hypothetical protein [Candidatus Sacchlamyda saccharinae]
MNKLLIFLLPILLFTGCRNPSQTESIVSMQMLDRNGFSETISNKDRLDIYEKVDFLDQQPYEKVLRVYNKNGEGKSPSKLTSYHDNGGPWQYLEALDGRANGKYMEWHENGKLKISAHVIEGLADLDVRAQTSWLFDKECTVWDENGDLSAEFLYEKGHLVGEAKYYYPSGNVQKTIPYSQGRIHGSILIFDEEGNTLEEITFKHDKRDGKAFALYSLKIPKSEELYQDDLLLEGIYYDRDGTVHGEISNGQGVRAEFTEGRLYSLIEYQNGIPQGKVQLIGPNNQLQTSYQLKEGMKTGEEWEYYSDTTPKLYIQWFEDQIQGMVKTWYANGKLESQREMSNNKKHGLSFGYYKTGDLMLMEEYDSDKLTKGSYYKKGDPTPISTIEDGSGVATLYNPEGHFTHKIEYERGKPVAD